MKNALQIRDITKATGLSRETLRFYEKKGLLPKPGRTDAGYRQFDSSILDRIKFIKLAQEVGFTLREISALLSIGEKKALSRFDLRKLVDEKIDAIDARILKLHSMRTVLKGLAKTTARLTKSSSCPILSQFKKLDL